MKAHVTQFEQDQTLIGFDCHPGGPTAYIERMTLTLQVASVADGVTEVPVKLDASSAYDLGRTLLAIAKQLDAKSQAAHAGAA